MKKKRALPALLFLTLTLSLAACGSNDTGYWASGGASESANRAPSASSVPMSPDAASPGYGGMAQGGFPSSAGSGSYYENTKVILTADLSLQATDFDGAVAALDALVTAQEGYYESSEYSYGGYHSSGNRWGYFTIRVPRAHYQAFLSAVGDVAHLTRRTTGTQDVGEAYYDAELRLETLKTKHERLLTLLDKAERMEDIISLEAALSDVEYQIQQYTSTLTRYDGLIDFATVHLGLQEVVRVSDAITEKDPLGARVGAAFSQGWQSFCDGMADVAVWAAYNFVGLLIFLVILAAAVVVLVRVLRRRTRRYAGPQQPKDSE